LTVQPEILSVSLNMLSTKIMDTNPLFAYGVHKISLKIIKDKEMYLE
jgi:hypothetical protein